MQTTQVFQEFPSFVFRTIENMRSVYLVVCAFAIFLLTKRSEGMTYEQMVKASRGIRSTCQSKIGTDIALIEGMKNGEFPADRSLQCYIHCVLRTTRSMNKQDQIDLDMTVKQVRLLMSDEIKERVVDAAKTCAPQASGDDPCVYAASFAKCNYNQGPDIFFFP